MLDLAPTDFILLALSGVLVAVPGLLIRPTLAVHDRERMDGLARHIEQAHEDAQKVNTSRKLSERCARIERVDLDTAERNALDAGQTNGES